MLDTLREILQSHRFLVTRNVETPDCPRVKRIKCIFADIGKSGIRFEASFYYLK